MKYYQDGKKPQQGSSNQDKENSDSNPLLKHLNENKLHPLFSDSNPPQLIPRASNLS
jgi:hypothetical protein